MVAIMSKNKRGVTAILAVLVIAELTSSIESNMVFAALKTIIDQHNDPVRVGWLVTGFLLVSAASAAICGRLGDLFGRRKILLMVLAMSALGSSISALNQSLDWVIFGRCVQGLSGAILPLCFGIARELLPANRLRFGIGVISASAALGGVIGMLGGGLIVDHFGWQQIFTVTGISAAFSLASTIWWLPHSPISRITAKLDIFGGLLFVPGIGLLLLAVSDSANSGWSNHWVLLEIGISVAILSAWTLYELRHPSPLINVRLLADRNILLANLGMALIAGGTFQSSQVFALVIQQPTWTGIGMGATATMFGLVTIVPNLAAIASSILSGHLSERLGLRLPVMLGAGLASTAWLALIVVPYNIWTLGALATVIWSTSAIAFAAFPIVVVASVPSERTSEASGVLTVSKSVFRAVGAQGIMLLLSISMVRSPLRSSSYPAPEAYIMTFAAVSLTCLCVVLLGYFIRDKNVKLDRVIQRSTMSATKRQFLKG